MAAAASSIQQLGTPYSQTRPPSASSDYSLSPITPRESFSTALRLMDGPGIDVGLSGSTRTTGFNTPDSNFSEPPIPRYEHFQALRRIEMLQNQVQELERVNYDLTTTVKVMSGMAPSHDLAGVEPAFVNVRGLIVPSEDIPSPKYDEALHGKFKFWSVDDWAPYAQGGPKADFSTSDQGVSLYLEDDEAETFTPDALKELRSLLKRCFRTLVRYKLHPVTWGKREPAASRYVVSEVYKVFPSLANCRGHFRVHTLATRMYPDFKKLPSNGATEVNVENVGELEDGIPTDPLPGPRNTKRDGSASLAHPAKRAKYSHNRKSGAPHTENTPAPSSTPHAPFAASVQFHSFSASYKTPTPQRPYPASVSSTGPSVSSATPGPSVSSVPPGLSLSSALPGLSVSSVPLSTVAPVPLVSQISRILEAGPSLLGLDNPITPTTLSLSPHGSPVPFASPLETSYKTTPGKLPIPTTPARAAADVPDELPVPTTPVHAATDIPDELPVPTTPARAAADVDPQPAAQETPQVFLMGNPLDALRSATAPALPSLLTPAMRAIMDGSSAAATSSQEESSGGANKKGSRMRASKSRTPRNLYAYAYLKEHPSTTTDEFNYVYKGLDSDVLEEYHRMSKFALGRDADESLDEIVEAFQALGEVERLSYRTIPKPKGRPAKGKGKGKLKATK